MNQPRRIQLILTVIIVWSMTTPLSSLGAQKQAQDQVEVITRFYKDYLNSLRSKSHPNSSTSFLSKSLTAAWKENGRLCSTRSRGDDICGFGTFGDVYLDAQEISPTLNFKTSEFKAEKSGANTVDVSFTVWPGQADSQSYLRFFFVDENGKWQIDNIFYGKQRGVFPAEKSMRREITDENTSIVNDAKDLQVAWDWIKVYYEGYEGEPFPDRFSRFLLFPIEVCDKNGVCSSVKRADKAKIKWLVHSLHEKCPAEKKANAPATDLVTDKQFGQKESINPKENDSASNGAFNFTFRDSTWWIIQIDLRKSCGI